MNQIGIKPVEYKVLILPDEVDDRSMGGIFLPENSRDREQMAQDKGVLVDASDMAFSDWKGRKPKVGDKVIFNKYAGSIIQFRNDAGVKKYRLCNDKDICAIIEE